MQDMRILQVVNDMHRAGLETMLMNYYRNIDRKIIQFDFLTHRPDRSDYDDEIESLGGKVYYAPRLYPQNYPMYFSYMKRFFEEHSEYKIMHSHIDSMSYLPLLAGKRAGIPIRIAHSHNTSIDKDYKYILKQFFRSRLTSVANVYLACGEEAGKYLFGDRPIQVIPNAVEAEKFHFNQAVRSKKRKELGYKDEFVVGHVGRISYQKNHKFLIEIFYELLKMEPNAVLMLVGVGEKESQVREQIHKLGISEQIHFLGNRNDVSELYQAMDAFVLPSLFEGIPVVGVEAQFADLPCFFSDTTPKEVKFNEKTQFIALHQSTEEWAREILKSKGSKRNSEYIGIVNSLYDIRNAHSIIEKLYISLDAEWREKR